MPNVELKIFLNIIKLNLQWNIFENEHQSPTKKMNERIRYKDINCN